MGAEMVGETLRRVGEAGIHFETDDASRDRDIVLGGRRLIDDEVSLDESAVKAVFAVAVDTPTDVVEGEDGTFRIGRWTEKVDASVDPTLEQQVRDEGLSIGDFREALRADGLREKLEAGRLRCGAG